MITRVQDGKGRAGFVAETFGQALRRLRAEAGLSQPGLAALAHWSQSRISRAEHDRFVPLADIAGHLDRVLEAGGALIALQAAAAAERPTRRGWELGAGSMPAVGALANAGEVDDTDRRDVLRAVAVGFGALLTESSPRIIAAAEESRPPSRIGMGDVAELERQIAALDEWDRVVGGVTSRHALLGALRWATDLQVSCCVPAVRARLMVAVARLADLAGWAVNDAGLYGPARRLFLLGLDAAREANDMAMIAYIASSFARIQVIAGDPTSALDLAQLADNGGKDLNFTPPLISRLHMGQAMTYAKIPGQTKACLRQIGLAQDRYAAPGEDDPAWIGWYTPVMLDGAVGRVLYDLSLSSYRYEPSVVDSLTAAVDRYPSDRARSRAIAATRLANSLFLAREPEEASRHAMAALELARPVKSAMLADDLRTTGRLARRFPSVDASREVQHRLPGVLAAMT